MASLNDPNVRKDIANAAESISSVINNMPPLPEDWIEDENIKKTVKIVKEIAKSVSVAASAIPVDEETLT